MQPRARVHESFARANARGKCSGNRACTWSVTKRVIVLLCNYRLYRVGVLRNTHLELRVGMLRNTHSMFRWACYVTPIWSLPRPTSYRESVLLRLVTSCDCLFGGGTRYSLITNRRRWCLRLVTRITRHPSHVTRHQVSKAHRGLKSQTTAFFFGDVTYAYYDHYAMIFLTESLITVVEQWLPSF